MNRRSWVMLGAVVLFAGLLAYTLSGGSPQETESLAPDAFWREDRERVNRLEVKREDGTRLVLERTATDPEVIPYQPPERFGEKVAPPFEFFVPPGPGTEWSVVEPARVPADASTVASLLFTLAAPRPLEHVAGDASGAMPELEAFGLDPPRARVRIEVASDEGAPVIREIWVGDPTPIRTPTGDVQSYYVTTPEQPGVYTLSAYPIEALFGGVDGFRMMQFARFETQDAVAVRLLWDEKEPVELVRQGETWRLEGPGAAPADPSAVRDVLLDLNLLRAEEVVQEDASEEALNEYGLANPRGEAVVWLGSAGGTSGPAGSGTADAAATPGDADVRAGQEPLRARVVWVGNFLSDGSGVYVRLAGDRTVYRVRGDRLQFFFDATARPLTLAQRGLLPPGWQAGPEGSIERVTWEGVDAEILLERGEDGTWTGVEEAEALLSEISGFQAEEVLAVGPTAVEMAGWPPGTPLPDGAEQLRLEPAAGSDPDTPVIVTRLPGEETVRDRQWVRILWTSGEDRLLLRADPDAWRRLAEPL